MGKVPFSSSACGAMVDVVRSRLDPGDKLVMLGFRGSVAHGMYSPSTDPDSIDDVDLIGVVVPHERYYLGLSTWHSSGTYEIKDGPLDIVLYDLKKYMHLLTKGNPNVLITLFLDPEFVLVQDPMMWRPIVSRHDLFISQEAYWAFVGYATSQLREMAHGATNGYMGEKRKALVQKFGYDTKNAAHCIRILRMGCEMFMTGRVEVYRHDANELMEIKRGGWSLDQVRCEADRLFEQLRHNVESSELPVDVDHREAEDLCCSLLSWVLMCRWE